MNWPKELKANIRFNEPLSKHTTFGIGGKIKFWVEPKNIQDLKKVILNIKKYKIFHLVIGNGSNLLVKDKNISGVAISLKSDYFSQINYKKDFVEAGAGVALNKLVKFCLDNSLRGLEFLSGIPGTIGGAVIMNAGTKDKSISDIIKEVKIMDPKGNIKTLRKKDIKFGYRKSNLSKFIVISIKIYVTNADKDDIRNRLDEFLEMRKRTQDLSFRSAGCIFKNPRKEAAGKLIDLCGLKGKCFGDAEISRRHANFIINRGKAKAKDVLRLIKVSQEKVKNNFNIDLIPEVKIIG
ncbi:MAG: UDP-N-acetylmuramate dehydrogenase [Candidatus Omnitrophota bacterium]